MRINFLNTAGPLGVSHSADNAKYINSAFTETEIEGNPGWVIFNYGNAGLAEKVYILNFRVSE